MQGAASIATILVAHFSLDRVKKLKESDLEIFQPKVGSVSMFFNEKIRIKRKKNEDFSL